MIKIVIGTTPTIEYKLSIVSPADITDAIFTIQKGYPARTVMEKTLESAGITEDSISWKLTQEETLNLGIGNFKMMLNWVAVDGTRGASEEADVQIVNNHVKEVM